MSETSPADLIGTFGFQSGKDVDKFKGVDYELIAGAPVLKNTCGYVVCKVVDKMETSTHTVFLGEVIEADVYDTSVPEMTYSYYHKVVKGKSPKNAPTYLAFYEEDRKYILDNMQNLVIKDVSEAGGYGVIFGRDLSVEQLENLKQIVTNESRRFIAQEVIDFLDLKIVDGNEEVERKADLRAFVLSGEKTKVWPSGLTRFSRNPDSFVVNSSQGGGFKDTWVLSR